MGSDVSSLITIHIATHTPASVSVCGVELKGGLKRQFGS